MAKRMMATNTMQVGWIGWPCTLCVTLFNIPSSFWQRLRNSNHSLRRTTPTRWVSRRSHATAGSSRCRTPIWVPCRIWGRPRLRIRKASRAARQPLAWQHLAWPRSRLRRLIWTRSRASRRCPAHRCCCPTMIPSTVPCCHALTRYLPSWNSTRRRRVVARSSFAWCMRIPQSMPPTAILCPRSWVGEYSREPKSMQTVRIKHCDLIPNFPSFLVNWTNCVSPHRIIRTSCDSSSTCGPPRTARMASTASSRSLNAKNLRISRIQLCSPPTTTSTNWFRLVNWRKQLDGACGGVRPKSHVSAHQVSEDLEL